MEDKKPYNIAGMVCLIALFVLVLFVVGRTIFHIGQQIAQRRHVQEAKRASILEKRRSTQLGGRERRSSQRQKLTENCLEDPGKGIEGKHAAAPEAKTLFQFRSIINKLSNSE